jgi:hypothetical protein
MPSRVYGASEDKILAQLERNLDEAWQDGAGWRTLAALIVGAAVPLAELVGELEPLEHADRVEIRTLGDPEPQYVTVPSSGTWSDFVEFWDGARPLIDLPALRQAEDEWGDES